MSGLAWLLGVVLGSSSPEPPPKLSLALFSNTTLPPSLAEALRDRLQARTEFQVVPWLSPSSEVFDPEFDSETCLRDARCVRSQFLDRPRAEAALVVTLREGEGVVVYSTRWLEPTTGPDLSEQAAGGVSSPDELQHVLLQRLPELVPPERFGAADLTVTPWSDAVTIRVDGRPCPRPCRLPKLKPGVHEIEAADRRRRLHRSVRLEPGAEVNLLLSPSSKRTPLWKRPWLWAAVAATAAGVVTAAVVASTRDSTVEVCGFRPGAPRCP